MRTTNGSRQRVSGHKKDHTGLFPLDRSSKKGMFRAARGGGDLALPG